MEYYGDTLKQAVSAAVNRQQKGRDSFTLVAPPFWSPWVPVVLEASNPSQSFIEVYITYDGLERVPSDVSVEIEVGSRVIRDTVPGSVSFVANAETEHTVYIRLRSDEVTQDVAVTVSSR